MKKIPEHINIRKWYKTLDNQAVELWCVDPKSTLSFPVKGYIIQGKQLLATTWTRQGAYTAFCVQPSGHALNLVETTEEEWNKL